MMRAQQLAWCFGCRRASLAPWATTAKPSTASFAMNTQLHPRIAVSGKAGTFIALVPERWESPSQSFLDIWRVDILAPE